MFEGTMNAERFKQWHIYQHAASVPSDVIYQTLGYHT